MAESTIAKREESEVTRRGQQGVEYYTPAVDIFETSDSIILKYDMPGVDKENLEITADKNLLTVIGNVAMDDMGEAVYQETRIGSYRREFTLPDDVDTEKITAEIKAGVLTVTVGKPEKAKPKKITIKSD